MKNSLFLIIFVLSVCSVYAQSDSFDQRLLSKFTKDELNLMQTQNPIAYAYWNFYVANAFQIMDFPDEKANKLEIKGIAKVQNLKTINIFDLNYIPLTNDYQYFRIEGSKKILVILSEEQIKDNFVKSTKK